MRQSVRLEGQQLRRPQRLYRGVAGQLHDHDPEGEVIVLDVEVITLLQYIVFCAARWWW